MKELFDKIKSVKGWKLIVAVALAAIAVLLLFAGSFDKKSATDNLTEQSYIEKMQNKIVSVVQSMDGCGKTEVAVSCSSENGKQYAYDTVIDSDGTKKTTVALVGGKPLVERELPPQIFGVVVVCEGATDPVVRMKIARVVVTLLDVDIGCVQVFAYKV